MSDFALFTVTALGALVAFGLCVRWWPRRIPPGRSVADIARRIHDEDHTRPPYRKDSPRSMSSTPAPTQGTPLKRFQATVLHELAARPATAEALARTLAKPPGVVLRTLQALEDRDAARIKPSDDRDSDAGQPLVWQITTSGRAQLTHLQA
ncbi:hypothetical protein [Nocardia wallacei]|uniref:hypothetical protein n=1 Tax=Nocardia wallacei TaxID=480035 RepID=UPI0024551E4D|nr:hypothetical protein [Nocardia wallacei]